MAKLYKGIRTKSLIMAMQLAVTDRSPLQSYHPSSDLAFFAHWPGSIVQSNQAYGSGATMTFDLGTLAPYYY